MIQITEGELRSLMKSSIIIGNLQETNQVSEEGIESWINGNINRIKSHSQQLPGNVKRPKRIVIGLNGRDIVV